MEAAATDDLPQRREATAEEKRLTFGALMIVFLLSALDQTIVSTAMPTIIQQLNGLELYAWVTTSYLLTSTVMVPIWGKLGDTLRQLGQTLQTDARLRMTINRFARRAAVGATASYGDGIVKLVSDTIRSWDVGKVTERVESAVGRDLQYIRINGTLVGGLVGLAIHAVDVWF